MDAAKSCQKAEDHINDRCDCGHLGSSFVSLPGPARRRKESARTDQWASRARGGPIRRRTRLAGRRGRRGRGRLAAQLLLLGLDELAIVRRIEIQQRPAGGEMLDEYLADDVGRTRGDHRHRDRADDGSDTGQPLQDAAGTHGGGARSAGRDHRASEARYHRFAHVVGKRDAVNLRKAAEHLQLHAPDRGHIDKRDGDQASGSRPPGEALDQLRGLLVALLIRQVGRRGRTGSGGLSGSRGRSRLSRSFGHAANSSPIAGRRPIPGDRGRCNRPPPIKSNQVRLTD